MKQMTESTGWCSRLFYCGIRWDFEQGAIGSGGWCGRLSYWAIRWVFEHGAVGSGGWCGRLSYWGILWRFYEFVYVLRSSWTQKCRCESQRQYTIPLSCGRRKFASIHCQSGGKKIKINSAFRFNQPKTWPVFIRQIGCHASGDAHAPLPPIHPPFLMHLPFKHSSCFPLLSNRASCSPPPSKCLSCRPLVYKRVSCGPLSSNHTAACPHHQ